MYNRVPRGGKALKAPKDGNARVARGQAHAHDARPLVPLALGALGVVYGDIGTSPLYAMRECFSGVHSLTPDPLHVYAVLSLIFWSLILIISVKYCALVLRADNRGEGGILALLALIRPESRERPGRTATVLIATALLGAALLYGDGMITPAISVLSAVEGLAVTARPLAQYVVPLTILILFVLFGFQRHGTERIARIFGPVTLLWFVSIALVGIHSIWLDPQILWALDPRWAVRFFVHDGFAAFLILGSVFLAVTGGEALYADMGHFGRTPIRAAWFTVVLPALLLNYFGQGALLLRDPRAVENPFYLMVPEVVRIPMLVVATAAACIASQAVISGAFSLTRAAVQLGYLPRVEIRHTSDKEIGQIFIPEVNMLLLIASVGLVLFFQEAGNLAGAYGIAVAITMTSTTMLIFFVMWRLWHWRLPWAIAVAGAFLLIDLAFLVSNFAKILHGGWFPLLIGVLGFTVMSTWRRGRELLAQRLEESSMRMQELLSRLAKNPPQRVAGTAIFMTATSSGVPSSLLQNLRHNRVLHERVVLLTMQFNEVPRVPVKERIELYLLEKRFYRVIAHYGFQEEPNVLEVLELCRSHHLHVDLDSATFFLAHESLLATHRPGMALWRERLFAILYRNASRPTAAFHIPPGRVVEMGAQIEL
jgi:KUP system potassium uptake protein